MSSSSAAVMMLPMSDGHDIPQIFCAAFRLGSTGETKAHVYNMYESGVRHFEIAELHGNGHTVCEALREVATREEIFITLKVWPKSRNPLDVVETVNYLLQSYGLTYVNLLMMHAPIDADNKIEQYKALEEMKENNIAKSIGIANLNAVLLQDLLKNCNVQPAVYETEAHPFGNNDDMVEFCNDSSIAVMDNEPLCKNMRLEYEPLVTLANSLNMSSTKLMLLWAFTRGLCVGLSARTNVVTEICGGSSSSSINDYFSEKLSINIMDKLLKFESNLYTQWNPSEAVVDE